MVVTNTRHYLKTVFQVADFSSLSSILELPAMLWSLSKAREYTMLDIPRLAFLYRLTKKADSTKLPGNIVECGVANGGSAAILAYASRGSSMKRKIWLFDSFQGMPKPTEEDGKRAFDQFHEGWLKGDPVRVNQIFQELKIPLKNIRIVKGWFQDTFITVDVGRIALLHIDADWYESVKLCLHQFYDSVVVGGAIVLDDYGCWEGCRAATNEFLKDRRLKGELLQVDSGVAYYFRKS